MPKKKSIKEVELELEYIALISVIPFFRMNIVGGFSNQRLSYKTRIVNYLKELRGWIDCWRVKRQPRKRRKEINKLFQEEAERWSLLLIELKENPDKFHARIAKFEEDQRKGHKLSNI